MTKRILTIDGGGLRGVFAAAVIEQMERVTGKPAHEIFDCFCGTSAGALLAAGLAAGKTATYMKNLFIDWGAKINELQAAPGDHKDTRERSVQILNKLLIRVFGKDLRPSQLKKRLAIPARNMHLGQVVFFGNFPADQLEEESFWDDHPGVNEDDPLWEIVRRSAALPPLFSPDGPYLDGGVSPFANPSYAAYKGIQRRLGWNPCKQGLCFHAVGTGFHRTQSKDLEKLDDTQLYSKMVGAMMQDINFLQHQVMKHLQGEGTIWYKRYNISFDRAGFEWFGLPVPSDEEFTELARTATRRLKELAEIGEVVGRKLVQERDFRERAPITDRRRRERRSGADRRLLPGAVTYDHRSPTPRRRAQERRVLERVIAHPSQPQG